MLSSPKYLGGNHQRLRLPRDVSGDDLARFRSAPRENQTLTSPPANSRGRTDISSPASTTSGKMKLPEFATFLAAVSFCGGGILERHPRLRVAFLEGNASWIPFLLWRMDEHYEWLRHRFAAPLVRGPRRYFKRPCFVSAP